MNADKLLSELQEWLKANHILFEAEPDQRQVSIDIEGESGSWRVIIVSEEDPLMLQVLCRHPLRIPKCRLNSTSLMLHKINTHLRIGSFGLRESEEHIYYRLGCPVFEQSALAEQFARMMVTAFNTFDDYFLPLASHISSTKAVRDKVTSLLPDAEKKKTPGIKLNLKNLRRN